VKKRKREDDELLVCFRNGGDPLFIEERGASGWRRGRSRLHDLLKIFPSTFEILYLEQKRNLFNVRKRNQPSRSSLLRTLEDMQLLLEKSCKL